MMQVIVFEDEDIATQFCEYADACLDYPNKGAERYSCVIKKHDANLWLVPFNQALVSYLSGNAVVATYALEEIYGTPTPGGE